MNNNIFGSVMLETVECRGRDTRTQFYIAPKSIVRQWGNVQNAEHLIGNARTLARIDKPWYPSCTMKNEEGSPRAARDYWGGMLDMGATTFWEHFDIDWTKNATRIDEFPTEGKDDVHGDFGKHCYIGLRHSLCHGWAAGPCPWLIENELGVRILEAGMKKIEIKPCLEGLEFVKGTVPTPYGPVCIEHKRTSDGEIITSVDAPDGVEVICVK